MSSNGTVVQLKSAQLRRYLHEGHEGWYIPLAAEAVLGLLSLLHISLFLFFAGLGDSLRMSTLLLG